MDLIAEIKKLHKQGVSTKKIAVMLKTTIYNVVKHTNTDRFYESYCKNRNGTQPVNCKIINKKRFEEIKKDCKDWINSYYEKAEINNYDGFKAFNDYEYSRFNPVFLDSLTKSQFTKCMIECGFEKNIKKLKEKQYKYTTTVYWNCRKKC